MKQLKGSQAKQRKYNFSRESVDERQDSNINTSFLLFTSYKPTKS